MPAEGQSLINTLLAMVEAHNRHDLEAELSCYTDDAQFEIVGRKAAKGKNALRSLFVDDAQRNSRLTLTDLTVQGNTVVGRGKEQNDRFTELGMDCIYFDECRFTFRDGLICQVKSTISRDSDQNLHMRSSR